MSPIVISNCGIIASRSASILSSISRIVESNNLRDIELCRINKRTEVAINKIKCNAKVEKAQIDYCCNQIRSALNSSKLSSSQKRQVFEMMMDTLEKI
jgi:hypothetical protein